MLSFTHAVGARRHDLNAVDLVGLDARILGGGGNDVIEGSGSGNSRLYREVLDGGEGDDRLYGNGGGDLLLGGFGVDRLEGGDGNDLLCDWSGRPNACDPGQEFYGGLGNDLIYVGREPRCPTSAPTRMAGGEGRDRCGDSSWDTRAFRGMFEECRPNVASPPDACARPR